MQRTTVQQCGYGYLLFSHSVVSDSLRPHGLQHTRLRYPPLSPWSLLRFTSTESVVMLSNHLILCCPLLLLSSVFPSARVFSISMDMDKEDEKELFFHEFPYLFLMGV